MSLWYFLLLIILLKLITIVPYGTLPVLGDAPGEEGQMTRVVSADHVEFLISAI